MKNEELVEIDKDRNIVKIEQQPSRQVDENVIFKDGWKIVLYENALKKLTEYPPIGMDFEYYIEIAKNALADGKGEK